MVPTVFHFCLRAIASTVALLLLTSTVCAQNTDLKNLPQFDVVSIRPHQDEGMMRMGFQFGTVPDGVVFKGGTLDMLIHMAFDVPRDRILNEPDWVRSSRIDLDAKVAPEDAPKLKTLTRQQQWAMIIPALEDRCALKFHHETRELEVYTLVLAKGGSKLKEAAPADPHASAPSPGNSTDSLDTPGSPGQPPAAAPMMLMMNQSGVTVKGRSATIDSFVQMLSQQMGATIVDKPGLTGKYDYELAWMPDEMNLMGMPMMPMPHGPPPQGGSEQPPPPTAPSIFAALPEQVGLKLETHKEPVDVIVIDHMEQPSAN